MSAIHLPDRGPFSLLVLGGARSGKSAYGERIVAESAARHIYLATAEAHDGEMQERIAHHKSRRGEGWHTIEEPLAIAKVLRSRVGEGDVVLVDCLTLWLSNLMAAERDVQAAYEDRRPGSKLQSEIGEKERGIERQREMKGKREGEMLV